MPIYFGIPVRVGEAIRILNLNLEKITEEVIKQKYYSDYTFVDVANKYLKNISITKDNFFIFQVYNYINNSPPCL